MPLVVWKDSFLTGFAEIDTQHKQLVEMINTLFDAISKKERQSIMDETFKGLINYTVIHFKLEEELMKKYAYIEFLQHKKEHAEFVSKVAKLSDEFKSGNQKTLVEVINFLKDWLLNHIMFSDRKYIETFKRNGVQ